VARPHVSARSTLLAILLGGVAFISTAGPIAAAHIPRMIAPKPGEKVFHSNYQEYTTYDRFTEFKATGLPSGATVTLRCATGCHGSEVLRVGSSGTASARTFLSVAIPIGAKFVGEVRRRGWIGYYRLFTVKQNHKVATIGKRKCLALHGPDHPYPCVTTPPSAPTGVAVVQTTATSATVHWTAVGGTGTRYFVYVNKTQVADTRKTIYTFRKLQCAEPYTLSVAAHNMLESTSDHVPNSVTTAACPPPAKPKHLRITRRTASSMTLKWRPSHGMGVTGYSVFADGSNAASGLKTARYTFKGLTCGVKHTLDVQATNRSNVSSSVASMSGKTAGCSTAVPAAPRGLAVTAKTTSSITVSWQPVPGATGYRAFKDGHLAGQATKPTFVFTGVSCGNTYKLAVTAHNKHGSSSKAPTTAAPSACRVTVYNNYGSTSDGIPMCRGNPSFPNSMPGGTASQTITVPSGVTSIDTVLVQIDPASTVTAHASLWVNGVERAAADETAAGDNTFSFSPVAVHQGDSLRFSVSFTATYGQIITVYEVGNPGGTFSVQNSCPNDNNENFSKSSPGLRAVISGWNG